MYWKSVSKQNVPCYIRAKKVTGTKLNLIHTASESFFGFFFSMCVSTEHIL